MNEAHIQKHVPSELLETISIISETADYIVINKPSGVQVHSDGVDKSGPLLTDWIESHYPECNSVGEYQEIIVTGVATPIARPGIVHRLDRDTSGVMVIARTQAMYDMLKNQFQKHDTLHKEYRALVYGTPRHSRGVMRAPIGRDPNHNPKFSCSKHAVSARDAITYYETLVSFVADNGNQYSLLRCKPITGRTHQIRVHLAHNLNPVVCDTVYATSAQLFPNQCLGFRRQALHAYSLIFYDLNNVEQSFVAPLPQDFVEVLKKYNISFS